MISLSGAEDGDDPTLKVEGGAHVEREVGDPAVVHLGAAHAVVDLGPPGYQRNLGPALLGNCKYILEEILHKMVHTLPQTDRRMRPFVGFLTGCSFVESEQFALFIKGSHWILFDRSS